MFSPNHNEAPLESVSTPKFNASLRKHIAKKHTLWQKYENKYYW